VNVDTRTLHNEDDGVITSQSCTVEL